MHYEVIFGGFHGSVFYVHDDRLTYMLEVFKELRTRFEQDFFPKCLRFGLIKQTKSGEMTTL